MERKQVSRRDFVKTTTAAGIGFWVAGTAYSDETKSTSPNERIKIACIGVGGKGGSDSSDAANHGDIVAICDVDDKTADNRAKNESFKKAKRYNDFRKMLDEMGKSIDAVTVSIPDHNHAAASLLYMRAGKHCFCQKPLTHSIYEARVVGETAKEMKVATQMGNQGTANDSLRETAAMIRAGSVGTVKEVHVWTNRPIWAQGGKRPAPAEPPANLHWDLWLGPAAVRPYSKAYHPFAWRGFWDFGTGALGDMACHTVNMPFMALDLFDPISVEAESSGNNKEMYPNWSIIKFEFPANNWRPKLSLTWYDGTKRPGKETLDLAGADAPGPDSRHKTGQTEIKKKKKKKPDVGGMSPSGCLVVGDKGKLYAPGDYCEQDIFLLGGATPIAGEWEKSPGHFEEWIRSIKGGPAAHSNFPGYASRLTQTILLGNLAVWAGTKVEWDPKELKATNLPELEAIVHPKYRAGYTM